MIEFVVPGAAAPQGSKRPMRLRSGRTVLIESSKRLKPWRAVFALAASEAWTRPPHAGVVALELTFRFVRPRSHFTSKGAIRAGAPLAPPRPDLDKLVRGACDSMTGVVYVDDSQVGCIWAAKEYGDRDETLVSVVT